MTKIALVAFGIVCLFIAVVVVVGYLLPVAHVASRETRLAQPPERVFALLSDVAAYPRWRSDVKTVDVVSPGPPPRWVEHGRNGDIMFEMTESQAPRRLVSRIADPSLPFGGTWTYELSADGSGTRVKVTEHGQVFNPVFRLMSRFVFGHTATMDHFLRDLQTRAT